jgi:uncharacterized membrane protein YkgB
MQTLAANPVASSTTADRARLLTFAGTGVLRYGLVFLLTVIGLMKFFELEAESIKPLLESSPFLSWMLHAFGTRGASAVIGVIEIATGLGMATRRFKPLWSGYASLAASVTFLVTLSFLFTTPGVTAPTNPMGGFLMKDLILLGAALFTAGEALSAAERISPYSN